MSRLKPYLGVLLLLVSYLALSFLAPVFWPLQIFSIIPPFLFALFPLIFFMRYALKKDLIGVFLALLFLASSGLCWEVRPLAFLDHVQSGSGIKVFTANAPLWYIGQNDAYGQFLKNQNADIYQLQEMIPPTSTAEPKTEFLG